MGHLLGEERASTPQSGGGGSSRRKRSVAKENGATPDWIIVVVAVVLDADIQTRCLWQHPRSMNWQSPGAEPAGSKTPGDSGTPQPSMTNNC